ncbi:MAG: hypothetical protein ACXW3S_13930 [Rhodoplanes sp.]
MVKVLVIVTLLVVVGGLGFLATWDIPAPQAAVEKVVPQDRFHR